MEEITAITSGGILKHSDPKAKGIGISMSKPNGEIYFLSLGAHRRKKDYLHYLPFQARTGYISDPFSLDCMRVNNRKILGCKIYSSDHPPVFRRIRFGDCRGPSLYHLPRLDSSDNASYISCGWVHTSFPNESLTTLGIDSVIFTP